MRGRHETRKRRIPLGKVDDLIVRVLSEAKEPLSTYDIAKRTNLAWSTTNTHCYKLMSMGMLDSKEDEVRIGIKRIVWWLIR